MSERDDDSFEQRLSRTRKVASAALGIALIALVWAALAMLVNHYQAGEQRDLRDRLERLERR
jgi:hypothetical protein